VVYFGYCPTGKTLCGVGPVSDCAHPANRRRIPRNAHQLGISQKQDAGYGTVRIGEPVLDGDGADWQGQIEHAGMPLNISSHAPVLRQNQHLANRQRMPAVALGTDCGREPRLGIQWAQRALERPELGLDFDDDERPGRSVPGQNVDRAALPMTRKCDLELDRPTMPAQKAADCRRHGRVSFVVQPIQSCATPIDPDPHDRSHGGKATIQFGHGDAREVVVLQLRDLVATYARCLGHGFLGSTQTVP